MSAQPLDIDVSNVILVVVDALRADRVGAIGSDKALTPTIDNLAAEGLTFTQAFSCINATDPSVTSMHTGLYPRRTVLHHAHLVTDSEKDRVESVRQVPEILQENGISTIAAGRAMGRWHRNGFDRYPEVDRSRYESSLAKFSNRLYKMSPFIQGIAADVYHTATDIAERLGETLDSSPLTGGTERDEIDEFFDALKEVETGKSSLYGFIHLMDTHAWYDADEERIEEMHDRYEYPNRDLEQFFTEHSHNRILSGLAESATDQDYESGLGRLIARYDATVAEADKKIERLVTGLRQRGLWDDTALIVLSDHGESLTEHGIYFDHHGLYDETIHVPVVCRVPEIDARRIEKLVELVDVAPTLLELFNIDIPQKMDGSSLLCHLHENSDVNREMVVAEEAHAQRRIAIRTEDWKLITHISDPVLEDDPRRQDSFICEICEREHGGRTELYDLTRDVEETTNVSSDHPTVVDEFKSRIKDFKYRVQPTESDRSEHPKYSDEKNILERLENLGYR